jgi:hypothetical protein
MPRKALLLVALALGAISASALVACGSNDEGTIPEANAQAMLSALAQASAAESNGDCDAVQESASLVADEAAAELPSDVDPEVRQAVIDGAEQLFDLAADSAACGGTEKRKTTSTTSTTSTPSTTSTTETTTSTTTEPPTVPTQPPDEGGNLGQGDQGGTPPDSGSGGTEGG